MLGMSNAMCGAQRQRDKAQARRGGDGLHASMVHGREAERCRHIRGSYQGISQACQAPGLGSAVKTQGGGPAQIHLNSVAAFSTAVHTETGLRPARYRRLGAGPAGALRGNRPKR